MKRRPDGSNDYLIHAALEAGVFQVNPSTGAVTNRDGKRIDGRIQDGYRKVGHRGVTLSAHRIVWIACEDAIPLGIQINHRNRIRHDNRICNLELTTAGENAAHAAQTPYYERIRDEDLAAVDPRWLERVIALAETGNATPDQIAALRPEQRAPVGSPEYRRWHDDGKVDHALSGAR